ncbi:hypothetical protein ACOSP7_016748 [Xanthoceras sorbifolium]
MKKKKTTSLSTDSPILFLVSVASNSCQRAEETAVQNVPSKITHGLTLISPILSLLFVASNSYHRACVSEGEVGGGGRHVGSLGWLKFLVLFG